MGGLVGVEREEGESQKRSVGDSEFGDNERKIY